MLVLICITCHRTWGVGPNPLGQEIDYTGDRIRESGRTIVTLQKELATARWKLDSARGVGRQPDWSVLLALLAEGLGHDVVLKSCELNQVLIPLRGTAGRPQMPPPAGLNGSEKGPQELMFVLTVTGFGRSQTAVSQFVLRLERSGLFDNVRLVNANRQPFLNGKAIAFQLECSLGGNRRRVR